MKQAAQISIGLCFMLPPMATCGEKPSRLTVLFFTGFSDQINKAQPRSEGIRAVLNKPVDKHELSLWIRKCLDDEKRS